LIGDVWPLFWAVQHGFDCGSCDLYENDIANLRMNTLELWSPQRIDCCRQNGFKRWFFERSEPKMCYDFRLLPTFCKGTLCHTKIPIVLLIQVGEALCRSLMSEETLKSWQLQWNSTVEKKTGYVSNLENKQVKNSENWIETTKKKDEGAEKNNWVSNATNTSDWSETTIPGLWMVTSQ
jgi:hypothetical protein